MRLSEEILHTPAYPHHCIHNTHTHTHTHTHTSWYITTPPHLPKRHLYIISSKKIIIQCILWRTGKTGKRWILLYLTDIPNAPVLNNSWIHMECMYMLLFGNIFVFFSNIYELFSSMFFETLFFVSLWECDFLVSGSGLRHTRVSAQGWFYYQTIRRHSYPQHVLLGCHGYILFSEKWGDTSSSVQNNETHKKNVLNLLSMVLKA